MKQNDPEVVIARHVLLKLKKQGQYDGPIQKGQYVVADQIKTVMAENGLHFDAQSFTEAPVLSGAKTKRGFGGRKAKS